MKSNNKLTWRDILSILQIVVPILSLSGLQFVPFFSKLLQRLSQYSNISLPMLRWSLVLMCFVTLSLFLSLQFIIKRFKDEHVLPPKKYIKQILLKVCESNSEYFAGYIKCNNMNANKNYIYFNYLVNNGYISVIDTHYPINDDPLYKFGLTDKGNKYIIRRKYI